LAITPNPVHDMMQLAINVGNSGSIDVHIFDMSGKIVRRTKANIQAGTNVISFDQLSKLQEGMYLVLVYAGGEIFRQKIVLVK
jgi:hypothetical protein